MLKFLLPAIMALPVSSFAQDICASAAEDLAITTAENSGLSECTVVAPTQTVQPDSLYNVSLFCTAGNAARTIGYQVTTESHKIRSPKTGKIFYYCHGVTAVEN